MCSVKLLQGLLPCLREKAFLLFHWRYEGCFVLMVYNGKKDSGLFFFGFFVFLRISIQLDTWAYNCARKECFEIHIEMG